MGLIFAWQCSKVPCNFLKTTKNFVGRGRREERFLMREAFGGKGTYLCGRPISTKN